MNSALNSSFSRNQVKFIYVLRQSAGLSWYQARIRSPWPNFYYRQTVADLLMWGIFSDDRTGL
jgi:hypothetical protein